ncbi:MAG: hypothetical protein HQ578_03320 [Chloroflexi bacterium]|nr:hypothetical protein [Chloroflexota bacterium]
MPEKLSTKKSLSIIRLYLNGLSYGEIAAKAGVGKGTVANIATGLKVGQFPEAGDVADQVEVLRELAVDLKHWKLTPAQASVGLSLLGRLHEMGVDPADIEHCAAVGHLAASEDTDTPSFIKAALVLEEARKQTGLGFKELEDKVKDLEEQVDHLAPLAQKAADYEGEVAELAAQRENLVGEVSQLQEHHKDLNSKLKDKEGREAELSSRVMELEDRVQVADEKLSSARKDIKVLAAMGMSFDNLAGFTQRLAGIAQRHGIGPKALTKRLLDELEQLDKGLGLEETVKGKLQKLQQTRKVADEAEHKLTTLRSEIQELGHERTDLQTALEQERRHIIEDLRAIAATAQNTIAEIRQGLSEGVEDSLNEVARLKDLAVELGQEMGQYETTLEANKWLRGLLSLAKGDTSADARQVRESSIPVLRGLSMYLDANTIAGGYSYLAKTSIDNALAELERWRLE